MSSNRLIVKNTIFLYIRMLLVMLVSLYTSRVVLDVLGVSDYGIYNVVGGFVAMLSFFNSSLSNASQRFLSIELGKHDYNQAKKVFNESIILYAILCVALLIVAETLGLWFVNNKLVIPAERLYATNFVYQFSVFTALMSVMQVPFMSVIIAEEKMDVYAYIGIVEVVLKLLIAICISKIHSFDRLIVYSLLLLCTHITINTFYLTYCNRKFIECKFKYYWDKSLIKQLISFISYNFFGCLAYSGAYQGASIILNLFFGTVVNAARGVALQISTAVSTFAVNIMTAIKPQLIKSYAQGDINNVRQLVIYASKYSVLLMIIIALPIVFNIDYILNIWLKQVPDYTNIFAVLVITDAVIGALVNPLWIVANATGKIKNMQVYGRTITLMALPISYLLLKFNIFTHPAIVFFVLVFCQIGYLIYCFFDIYKQISFSVKEYMQRIILPILYVTLPAIFVTWICTNLFSLHTFINFIILSVVSISAVAVFTFLFAVTKKEKQYARQFIKNKLKR